MEGDFFFFLRGEGGRDGGGKSVQGLEHWSGVERDELVWLGGFG